MELAIDKIGDVAAVGIPVDELDASNASELKREIAPVLQANAKVVLDSIAPNQARLTTLEVTIPRFLLAQLNTHRQLSRNAASSRAIPTQKMLAICPQFGLMRWSTPVIGRGHKYPPDVKVGNTISASSTR